jgi:hypothetical protein
MEEEEGSANVIMGAADASFAMDTVTDTMTQNPMGVLSIL